ncbi:MAG: TPM domain-containing protein, partial [Pseudomonadota bacterium]|nr:TPM domain-containing protein [Pseudomonadota bacterium]
MTVALAFLALLFAGLAPAHAADLKFPALTGRVVDDAHVLPADEQASLTQKLADLEAKTSRQLVVVTVPTLQGREIEDYGYQLGRAWGIGQKDTKNGTLFIIAPSEHKVRIEVGYGLEGILTDALTSTILQGQVLPRFKAGDVPGGVQAGTDALIEQMAADPSTAEQKAAAASQAQADQQVSYRSGRHHGFNLL